MVNEHKSPNSTDFRTGVGQTAYKRRLAYERLGVDPKDVETVPFLRNNLRRIFRCINQDADSDSRRSPLDYLLSSEDPDARKLANVYLSVPKSYRRLLPAEAFCLAAGVSPYRVLEIITGTAVRMGAMASTIVASVMQPHLVRKTIQMALQDDGVKDRQTMFRAVGFIPPRG
jgi:hypothetical protein